MNVNLGNIYKHRAGNKDNAVNRSNIGLVVTSRFANKPNRIVRIVYLNPKSIGVKYSLLVFGKWGGYNMPLF